MWEGIGGAIGNFVSSAYNNYMANDRQEDSQSYNAEQAAIDRSWRTQMDNTKYQRTVQDLKAADLNPMLAYGHGASAVGGGSPASSGTASPGGGGDLAAGAQAGTAAALNTALAERARAETDKIKAETVETTERTPTHAVTRASLEQGIAQSQEQIKNIIQNTATSGASAKNIEQQTVNLQETVPQIRATVDQLKTLAGLNVAHITQAGAQTGALRAMEGLTNEQKTEVVQRVKANLPALENALKELERQSQVLMMPGRHQQSGVSEGYMGALSATLRALNPFSDFIKAR